jgi:hypothetical protein
MPNAMKVVPKPPLDGVASENFYFLDHAVYVDTTKD